MGRRGRDETALRLLAAFRDRARWRQAELATVVGVSSRQVARRLRDLAGQGVPLALDESAPPNVYWTLSPAWIPDGVQFARDEVPELLLQVLRLPAGSARTRLLARIRGATAGASLAGDVDAQVTAAPGSDQEASLLARVVEALASQRVLCMRYRPASGEPGERRVSVQHVVMGPDAQFVGVLSGKRRLTWFRVARMERAWFDPSHRHVPWPREEVDRFVRASLGGFHRDEPVRCVFTVRGDDVGWVRDTLPGLYRDRYTVTESGDGLRVEIETAGVLPLARFVVGLGDAATIETPQLAEAVRRLAEGALHGASRESTGDERESSGVERDRTE